MLSNCRSDRIGARQRGAAAVEFGIVAIAFFLLFLGIVEFGRFFYLQNTVQEITRCAARQAVVHWKTQEAEIARRCIFRDSSGTLMFGWEVQDIHVQLRYLHAPDPDGTAAEATPDPDTPEGNISVCRVGGAQCINFVEASLRCDSGANCNASTHRIVYDLMFGLIPLRGIEIPGSTVTMPAESLGFARP